MNNNFKRNDIVKVISTNGEIIYGSYVYDEYTFENYKKDVDKGLILIDGIVKDKEEKRHIVWYDHKFYTSLELVENFNYNDCTELLKGAILIAAIHKDKCGWFTLFELFSNYSESIDYYLSKIKTNY